MKRFLLVLIFVIGIVLVQSGYSQVIFNFDDPGMGTAGFGYWWGDAGSNLRQMDDPTYGGVLALDITVTGDGKAAIGVDPFDMKWTENTVGAFFVTYDIFIPADFPDSAIVKVWSQDKTNWKWIDVKYSPTNYLDGAKPLIKGSWNSITFPVLRSYQLVPDYVPWNTKGGLEFYLGYVTASWTGTVMIDNITLWGVEPKLIADFNDPVMGTAGFGYWWGEAGANLRQMDDPTYGGILALDLTATGDGKAAIGVDPLDMGWTETTEGAAFLTFDVYVPEDIPDTVMIKVWSQDKTNWTWIDVKYSPAEGWDGSYAFQKGVWNTITFPIKRSYQLNNSYLPWNAKGGLEFYFGTKNGWTGTVYIDNARIHTMEVGKKWVIADFENEALGTYDFENTNWNTAMTAINWAADPTGRSVGVLQTDWDFALDVKAQFVNNNLDLQWTETDTGATAITMDVYLPANVPVGTQISLWASDKVSWTWTEDLYTVTDTTLQPGEWHTLSYDLMSHLVDLDPTGIIRAGVQVYSSESWAGTIYWDNYTLVGIEEPPGELFSPEASVAIDTSTSHGYIYSKVNWLDNEYNLGESYTVYLSDEPIVDLTADGVIRIGTKIPREVQLWNHRPYTTTSQDLTFYYAVTATGLDGVETELRDVSSVGPITVPTSPTMKAVYDPNFNFVIDGSLAEFDLYSNFALDVEGIGQDNAGDWTPTSTDLNLTKCVFVIDDDYLYFGANVVDDDLASEGQAWEGDALELYIGFYNALGLNAWHDLGDVDKPGTGDYRISFTAWGEVQQSGTTPREFPGMTVLILPSPTGYQIEAKITLDSLAATHDYTPQVGDLLPLRIDINDKDPVLDAPETSRTKQLNIGGVGNYENWKRPSCWGYLEVYSPTAVEKNENESSLPKKTQLHGNYPNPFNPDTHIKFDLAEAGHITIEVYNMLGQKIKTLIDADKNAGYHSVQWDGTNDNGIKVTSGIYLYKMTTADYSKTLKMILMK